MRDAFDFGLDQYVYFGGYPGAVPLISDLDRWAAYILDSLVETTLSRDVLLLSRVDLHGVLAEVEWPTIFFFIGLFILVGGIEEIGLLDRIARRAVELTGGDVLLTALVLLWLAGIASALVDNIPAVATLIPLTFAVARLMFPDLAGLENGAFAAHPDVVPLWWALALGACLGGNGTLVGASANVVAVGIAERRGDRIGFWGFTRIGAPFALVSMVVASVYLWLRYFAF